MIAFSELSVSIVLYNSNPKDISLILEQLISFRVYLIDNSPNDSLKVLCNSYKVHYLHFPNNPGFGVANNVAMAFARNAGSKYHFLINPDVYFDGSILFELAQVMKEDREIGMIMPQILNLDGSIQNLPKLLPSPLDLLIRKIKFPNWLIKKSLERYELRSFKPAIAYEIPIISGCFCLLNLEAAKEVGFFDNRYFMYFEDWDLSRKINAKYKNLIYPKVTVYHGYSSAANKNLKLFFVFLISAQKYFNKWGWFFDFNRHKINKKTLNQLKECTFQ